MKLLVLWTRLSGYMIKQFELLQSQGFEVTCIAVRASDETPFVYNGNLNIVFLNSLDALRGKLEKNLLDSLLKLNWDIILTASWSWSAYRNLLFNYKKLKKSFISVCAFDNQYKYTLKQRLGSLLSTFYVQSLFEYALVPGSAQYLMATKLGFKSNNIFPGLYTSQFEQQKSFSISKRFVFLGRLVKVKGIYELSRAFHKYTQAVQDPWPLHLIGNGDCPSLFDGIATAEHISFLSGEKFKEELQKGGVLVAPSLSENWGVNIHDATRFGMPLIVPRTSGAAKCFAQNGFNSFVLDSITVENIYTALVYYHFLDSSILRDYAESSQQLSNSISSSSLSIAIKTIIRNRKEQ